jgi:hypothetical protein
MEKTELMERLAQLRMESKGPEDESTKEGRIRNIKKCSLTMRSYEEYIRKARM